MTLPCDVVLDLMPLVKDGVASEASVLLVNEHLDKCENCRNEFKILDNFNLNDADIKDEKIISAIKRSIFISQFIVLIAGGIFGIALSNSMDMLYNLIIMPIIGGISYIILKRRWYLAPLGIFTLTFVWQSIMGVIEDGIGWGVLQRGFYFSVIYTFLVGLGVLIAVLLKFAFMKGEKDEK